MEIVINQDIKHSSTVGTSFSGRLNLTYDEIISIFGKPNCETDDYKVDWKWAFLLNGAPITIYNYKTGPNHGNKNVKATDIRDWHIGTKFRNDLVLLENYINQVTNSKFSDRKIIGIC